MTIKMLIDARHSEETRVVVQNGKRVEDFEFESAERAQLKGNIYLAKVTRVEPSLQAAFVDYGGNRHGFLPFSEIHPDYYQIPTEDREALLAQQRDEYTDDEDDGDEATAEAPQDTSEDADGDAEADVDSDEDDDAAETADTAGKKAAEEEAEVEEAQEKIRSKRRNMRKRYKIQEVIKKRQILLVQIVKEERGNKGAAATTYLSLAGRYCVLMPNSTHGGGISRKISNGTDRKRLRSVMDSLDLPDTMGCIIRTAGMKRTKTEIKRDFDYLTRLWEGIREATLSSIAPTLIHEEGNLIKRSIRDLYTREIEEVLVDGEEGYKTAKSFMKMLMPSHARRVLHYKEPAPLFQASQVDAQLQSIMSPVVQLRSGGYLVINPTEALVSIDVNSGKSTKEHNIEETALRTNLEAAEELARQLRLRDMAGLIVIDFIDMEDRGNNRAVERRMKDSLKDDRARVQVGRISQFGLLEMSRQRLRPGMLEATTMTCPHCHGTGIVRNVQSASLQALRAIEAEVTAAAGGRLRITLPPDVGLYLLNEKRELLIDLETRNDLRVEVLGDRKLGTDEYGLERIEYTEDGEERVFKAEPATVDASAFADDKGDDGRGKRKRRRRGRGRNKSDQYDGDSDANTASEQPADPEDSAQSDSEEGNGAGRKRKRRGRRGGRKNKEAGAAPETNTEEQNGDKPGTADTAETDAVAEKTADTAAVQEDAADTAKPPKRRRVRRKAKAKDSDADAPKAEDTPDEAPTSQEAEAQSEAKPTPEAEPEPLEAKSVATKSPEEATEETATPEPVTPEDVKAKRPARKSFWQRAFDRE
ncbi:MAG: Rne/Rng family ribonuclease [Pseudomonadota bacterium]